MTKVWTAGQVGAYEDGRELRPEFLDELTYVAVDDDSYVAYRQDGKVVKPLSFQDPDILGVLIWRGNLDKLQMEHDESA